MTLVRESATCAPEGTHLICLPLLKCSLMSFACNIVPNSEQEGGAVLLIRSYKDLQSAVLMARIDFGHCFNLFDIDLVDFVFQSPLQAVGWRRMQVAA